MTIKTYKCYDACQSESTAQTNLTAAEIVKHIYQEDGHGYRLEPRMESTYNNDGDIIGEQQANSPNLGLEWDVYFTKPGQRYSEKSSLIAWGATEKEAEDEFLLSAWKETRWDTTKWFIEAE